MVLAPIVLFVYNRPEHTKRMLNALTNNTLADTSVLHIFCDGPKVDATSEDYQKISEVKKVIRSRKWCNEVHIVEFESNKGLAANIIQGVTAVVNRYGKVIVLEDDIVTSEGFLKYMNEALDLYEQEDKVMHVSGYMFPTKKALQETFFYNTASCWGWGTWKRAWIHFEPNASLLAEEIIKKSLIDKFNVQDSYPFFEQLKANAEGRLKTWAVKWYASFFLKDGYSLHPYPSLVNNIGNDGSGENSGLQSVFHWDKLALKVSVSKIEIRQTDEVLEQMILFNKSLFRANMPAKQANGFGSVYKKFLPVRMIRAIKYLLFFTRRS